MTSQRSNESERDERFETVRTFVREWAMLDVADCVTDQLEALDALASIQAELAKLKERDEQATLDLAERTKWIHQYEAELSALREERDSLLEKASLAFQRGDILSRELEEARELLLAMKHGGGVSGTPDNHVHLNDVWSRTRMQLEAAAFLQRTALSGEGERP